MCGYFRVTSFFSIAKCVSPDGFFGIQISPNSITAGELTTPPPHSLLLSRSSASHNNEYFWSLSLSKIWLESLLLCLFVLSLLRNTRNAPWNLFMKT